MLNFALSGWLVALTTFASTATAATAARVPLESQAPPGKGFTVRGRLASTNRLQLAIALPLRNQPELEELIRQLYDPGSTNYHKYLNPNEFTTRFGPTESDYRAVMGFARSSGLKVARTHSNRVILDVEGAVSNIEHAFQVSLRKYSESGKQREFFAPDTEPSVPAGLPVADVWGLTDYSKPTPLSHQVDPTRITANNYNGSGPGGAYQGRDFRNAYVPGTSLTGAGQVAAVVQFDGYYANDIATYLSNCGYSAVPLTNVLLGVTGVPGYSGYPDAITEVSLDIELVIAMAPGLAKLMVYEGSNPYTVLNQIAVDNLAKQISCSWFWSYGPTRRWLPGHGNTTLDSILSQMAAQGQSFFQASGDSDAYTGVQSVNASTGPIPVDSIYVTSVGGTTLTMTSGGSSWSSETVWNWGNNTGSGGGFSPNYTLPSWQASVSMTANNGSTVYRNFPDVALTADAIQVVHDNGSSGVFGGTSCAAPLWAGFTALVNQQAAASGNPPVGFLNPALYSIAAGANYSACFHDITTGNNVGTNTPGLYNAVANYDLATGLGTPNGANLINALAPPASPYIVTQPSGKTVTNGANVTFSVTAGGQSPLSYQWLFNGAPLQSGGNVAGATSGTLSLTSVTSANEGNYAAVVSNSFGSVTSSVARLTVVFPPAFTTQPSSLSVVSGGTASLNAGVTGATPLSYQWRQNGVRLANVGNIAGANSDSLLISPVASSNAGNYTLVVTNVYGAATSSVATLTVLLPPAITVPPVAQTIECGSQASFGVGATGTAPLRYQWSLDGSEIPGATNATVLLADVHLPSHTVTVLVTNLYGSANSSTSLTVRDTLPPSITLNGNDPFYVELGGRYVEPGATASDVCAGTIPVTISGAVETGVTGTNTVSYQASDSSGNTRSATRTVIVRDTTAPSILWSFTNLVLTADANCSAPIPDVTGTNFILAADLSGSVSVTQIPAIGSDLRLGTNLILIAVADPSGNVSRSTNTVTVVDRAPPVVSLLGNNPFYLDSGTAYNEPGATAFDACAGAVPVTFSGSVDTSSAGTNYLLYQAEDGNGNTNAAIRTVIVRESKPVRVLWSFTNLLLAADGSCSASMPDVTGTNYIVVTNVTGALTITQTPVEGSVLPLGTSIVVLAAADGSGNVAYSTNTVLVLDETPPVVILNGTNPMKTELGATLQDAGAIATDNCSGVESVVTNGTVNVNSAGSYTLSYQATDGSGNVSTAMRTVIVVDTIPPAISLGFTDLTLKVDSGCTAPAPDVTGTNFIVATDLSGVVTITQSPERGTPLPPGTNLVVITAADGFGNVSKSTNAFIVIDLTPPRITTQPANLTIAAGSSAMFSVGAEACSPVGFQWFFNNAPLPAETNSTLFIAAASPAVEGNYLAVVTSSGGSTTSVVASLRVDVSNISVMLSSSENPSGFRQRLNWTATVIPTNAIGGISFLANGVQLDLEPLVGGSATSITVPDLPRGTNEITAVYTTADGYSMVKGGLQQVVTNHSPIVLPVGYTLTTNLILKIAVADLATNWSDLDGDALSIAAVGRSVNGVEVTNAGPTLIYSSSEYRNDQFVCTIVDGYGGTNFQTINIETLPQPYPPPIISAVAVRPGSGMTFSLTGGYGSTCVLESTTGLTSNFWVPLATNVIDATGVWTFTDPGAINIPNRYYRLKLLEPR